MPVKEKYARLKADVEKWEAGKEARKEYYQKRYVRKRERYKTASKDRYHAVPPEVRKEKRREQYAQQRELILSRNRAYKAAHRKEAVMVQTQYQKKVQAHDPSAFLLARTKVTAKRRGIEVTISKEDVIVPTICPVLGIPLAFGNRDTAPSIDRIDNSVGYVPGNVWVISGKANTMKNNASPEQLALFCTNMLSMLAARGYV